MRPTRHSTGKGCLKVRPGDRDCAWSCTSGGMTQGATVATLDSPDEGQEGFKLDPFSLSPAEHRLAFELKVQGGEVRGQAQRAKGPRPSAPGRSGGVQLPLTFRQTKTPTPVPKIVGPEQAWEGKLESWSRSEPADRGPRGQDGRG